MSLLSSISIKRAEKTHSFFLLLISFLLPITVQGLPLLTAVTALVGIVYYVFARSFVKRKFEFKTLIEPVVFSFKKIFEVKGLLYLVLFYLLHVVSIFWSEDQNNAIRQIILKSSFLYFPLLFGLANIKLQDLEKIAQYFVLGCFVGILANLSISFFHSEGDIISYYYTYNRLSHLLWHPSYNAVPIVIGINLILFHFSKSWKVMSTRKKIVLFSFLLLFSIYIMLLSSKAGVICWFLTFIIFAIFVMIRHKNILLGSGIILSVVLMVVVSYLTIDSLAGRVNDFSKNVAKQEKTYGSTGARKLLWSYAVDIAADNWMFGVGVGDSEKLLQKKFKEENQDVFFERNYNSHNQYLDTLIQVGVLGWLIFALIAVEFVKGMRYYAGLTICLLIVFGVNLLVESMLERQIGITLISWVLALSFVVRHNMENERIADYQF